MYCDYLQMVVRTYHIYQSIHAFDQSLASSDSVMEKMVKLILSHALKLVQLKQDSVTQKASNIFNSELATPAQGAAKSTSCTTNLGVFLWQHAIFELLYAVLRAYSQGIKENLKRGIDNLLVPDSVFTIGKPICMSLIHFELVRYNHRTSLVEKSALSAD